MQFKDYLLEISRRWWIVALVALSAMACSYLFTKLQSPVYRSTLLFVNSARLDWGTTMTVQVLLKQQEEQLKTIALASKVKDRMNLDLSPEEIRGKISTKAYTDSITVRLDVEDRDPERARLIALGYGQTFQEEKATEYAQATPDNRVNVTMLEEPQTGVLVRPSTKMNTLAGTILGLMVGLAVAMILEYLDDTLKTPEDIDRELNLATLGSIPRYKL